MAEALFGGSDQQCADHQVLPSRSFLEWGIYASWGIWRCGISWCGGTGVGYNVWWHATPRFYSVFFYIVRSLFYQVVHSRWLFCFYFSGRYYMPWLLEPVNAQLFLFEIWMGNAREEHCVIAFLNFGNDPLVRESIPKSMHGFPKIHGYQHIYPWILNISLQLSIQAWISALISKHGYPCKDIPQWISVNNKYP